MPVNASKLTLACIMLMKASVTPVAFRIVCIQQLLCHADVAASNAGRVIEGSRKQYTIATKFALKVTPAGGVEVDGKPEYVRCHPEAVRQLACSCESASMHTNCQTGFLTGFGSSGPNCQICEAGILLHNWVATAPHHDIS